MVQQVNIFLLLFGALQGGLLSLWFLRNRQRSLANMYFALFLMMAGLQLTFKVISKTWLMDHVSLMYFISYSFPFLAGPLLYLFVKARRENVFRRRDLAHFIPFLIAVINVLSFNFFWFNILPGRADVMGLLHLASLLTYSYLMLRLTNGDLRKLIITVMATEIVIAITLAMMQKLHPHFPDVRLLFLTLTLLVYWISYQILIRPDIFTQTQDAPVIAIGSTSLKYAHSSLKEAEATRIERSLYQLMVHDKMFVDGEITIDSLAARMSTSRHHLSQVLNERLKKTYGDYITDLRLAESCRRLSDPANYRFTIAAVAFDSGFNSVSSFNDVFKKRFGTTPSKFRDQQLKKMSA